VGRGLHEIEYDGYRMHARLDGGKIQLLTRTGLDWSRRYRSDASFTGTKTAYLDGERPFVERNHLIMCLHMAARTEQFR